MPAEARVLFGGQLDGGAHARLDMLVGEAGQTVVVDHEDTLNHDRTAVSDETIWMRFAMAPGQSRPTGEGLLLLTLFRSFPPPIRAGVDPQSWG